MQIVFVSEIKDPYLDGSSTQIMTRNLVVGLKACGHHVHFVAIVDQATNTSHVNEFYSGLVDELTLVKSRLNFTIHRHKLYHLYRLVLATVPVPRYVALAARLRLTLPFVLISHSPSVESVLICREVRRRNRSIRYLQYWSDPIALSGINPEDLTTKRWLHRFAEARFLREADVVIYGTKTLLEFQAELFRRLAHKFAYVDVSYSAGNYDTSVNDFKSPLFGYIGNADPRIRDVGPLLRHFENNPRSRLLVCGAGVNVAPSTGNIEIRGRVPQSEVSAIEASVGVFVCILNHSCIQLPGKIFYQTDTTKPILIVLDGAHSARLREYLATFKRFVFCENTEADIKKAVEMISSGRYEVDLSEVWRLTPQAVAAELLRVGGI